MLTRLPQSPFLAALLLCASCSSSPETSSQALIEPVLSGTDSAPMEPTPAPNSTSATGMAQQVPDFFEPKPWTGAFTETAVMLADTVRIEGPEGLLDHVAAASDDEYYERTADLTSMGFRQTIRRLGPDTPEIRVRIDRWTVAATQRVVILENINACEVTVVASGEAIWRDVDGRVAQADRLEFIGEIGQNAPVRPAVMMDATGAQSGAPELLQGSSPDAEGTQDGGSHDDSNNESPSSEAPQAAPADRPTAAPAQDPNAGSPGNV